MIVKSSIHCMQARKDLTIEVHVEGGPKVHKSFVLALLIIIWTILNPKLLLEDWLIVQKIQCVQYPWTCTNWTKSWNKEFCGASGPGIHLFTMYKRRTSHVATELNLNEDRLSFKPIYIEFGTCEVRRLRPVLPKVISCYIIYTTLMDIFHMYCQLKISYALPYRWYTCRSAYANESASNISYQNFHFVQFSTNSWEPH